MSTLRKVIISGSSADLNSLFVTNAVTASIFSGSFVGSGANVVGIASSSYAVTASYTNQIFSEGGTFADPVNGISFSSSFCVFRAPYQCQGSQIYGKRFGGSNCFVNARKSGSGGYEYHTASNMILSADNIWFIPNSIQSSSYISGESLELIISGSGNSQIAMQVDFVRI